MAHVKITYATLTADNPDLHAGYEAAVRQARDQLGQTHPMLIGEERRPGRAHFDDRNPADTRQLLGRFAAGTREDAREAVAAAKAAFPVWSRMPWPERLARLRRAADLISERNFELAAIMSLEAGKNRYEALGDVEEAADLIRYYCQVFEEAGGYDRPMGRLSPSERTRSILKPWGVWAVISPFNFPLALATGMSAGALVAGNTVVLKPASDTPWLGLRLGEILLEAGLPTGAFNCVTGPGGVVGAELVESHEVAGLIFTGSKAVGWTIWQRFNRTAIRPCILELGGKNPAIVTATANLETAAEGVMRSAYGLGGQKCSACSRVYVDRRVATAFTEALVAKTRTIRVGDPVRKEVFLGPLINEAAVRTFAGAATEAGRDGRVVTGGRVLEDGELARGYFVEPTLVTGLPPGHRLEREELFVPLLVLAEVDSLEEAIARANDGEYGLTAGIFSEDEGEVQHFLDGIEAGVTYVNRRAGATTGAWPGINPFGGWKWSGSSGKAALGPYYVAQFLREQSQTIIR
ncbi:MAG: aldehyde dehydrogenase family protein [Candidatus Rokubacteria bacterium]|nr:aldehyde dehydrogenase family protein [Candidatus Rokubacteria bacterium]